VALASAPSVPVTSVNRGDTVHWSIVVTNNSQTPVTNGSLTDALPAGFTYVSATPSPTSAPAVGVNGTVTWSGLSFPISGPTQTQTFAIDAVATTAGSFTNTGTITSTEAATVSASANLFVSGPILALTKTANTNTVVAPTNVTFTMEYANVGNANATLTYFGDSIPTGYTFVSATSSAGGTCVSNGVIAGTVTAGGSGYTSTPTVSITGGGGT